MFNLSRRMRRLQFGFFFYANSITNRVYLRLLNQHMRDRLKRLHVSTLQKKKGLFYTQIHRKKKILEMLLIFRFTCVTAKWLQNKHNSTQVVEILVFTISKSKWQYSKFNETMDLPIDFIGDKIWLQINKIQYEIVETKASI